MPRVRNGIRHPGEGARGRRRRGKRSEFAANLLVDLASHLEDIVGDLFGI